MHIIIYVIDALRADHLSCYGYNRDTSPNIDQLSRDGVLFESCCTPATWTRPVAASILTGVYPIVHKTRMRNERLEKSIVRLPQVLGNEGYKTIGIVSMGNLAGELGFDQGFDNYLELFRDPYIIEMRDKWDLQRNDLLNMLDENIVDIALPLAEDINDKLFPWLEEYKAVDTFIFLWSIEPHAPYSPPDEYRRYSSKPTEASEGWPEDLRSASESDRQRLINLYDDEIYYNDRCIGELVRFTKKIGIYDDTWFIIVGDHGEAFYEHGVYSHGHLPFEEVVHVPMIMKLPDNRFNDKRIEALVTLIDIFPTISENLGRNLSSEQPLVQGVDLMPLISGDEEQVHEFVFTDTQALEVHNRYISIRDKQWKLIQIQSPQRDKRAIEKLIKYVYKSGLIFQILRSPRHFIRNYFTKERDYLFNLDEDPQELKNLFNIHTNITNHLKRELTDWKRENQILAKQVNTSDDLYEESDVLKNHLEKLGYL